MIIGVIVMYGSACERRRRLDDGVATETVQSVESVQMAAARSSRSCAAVAGPEYWKVSVVVRRKTTETAAEPRSSRAVVSEGASWEMLREKAAGGSCTAEMIMNASGADGLGADGGGCGSVGAGRFGGRSGGENGG